MKIQATLTLTIDISEAEEMGYEISDPQEYAIDQFLDYVDTATRENWLGDVIEVKEMVNG
jgi:hypothetical protein